MAGNLVEDSISVQDLQDPSITCQTDTKNKCSCMPAPKAAHAYTFKHACSGHKRRRGSVQPSSSRAGKKSKSEIDRDYRERKKVEDEKLKAKTEELEKSNSHLEGQAFQLRMDLKETREEMKETREENINLKIVQKSQSESIRELGKVELIASGEKINALKEEHAQEIHALKAKHAQELLERDRKFNALSEEHELLKSVCTMCNIDLGKWLGNGAGEMNNPMETPATAQATSYFVNSDHFASQVA
ncbi:hypothetical protein POTOM_059669 [Populus tomentosa]|uniref:Uncharacterized protein n=1 Tax=Populus tomentosa TaxID=118781 RepID=A0A8X8C2A0_POPTO|nr:hypothetical protein POTOM_059669 [Populus tomentosa]